MFKENRITHPDMYYQFPTSIYLFFYRATKSIKDTKHVLVNSKFM